MLVIDASFAVETALDAELRKTLYEELDKGEEVVVPHIYQAEIANAFWKYVRAGVIEYGDAAAKMEEALGFVGTYVSMDTLLPEALGEALKLNHSVYDLFYFVLARRNAATLCTLDHKLQAICMHAGVSLVAPIDTEWEEAGRQLQEGE